MSMRFRLGVLGLVFGLLIVATPVSANVNNFRISSYKIEYQLSRDSENRSLLTTKETIVAEFPNHDQNRGLERAIPLSYDGHKTNVSVRSVNDQTGQARVYDTREESGNLIVRMADMDVYVHGQQTYVLTYDQRDVTRYFADNNLDEFYWDSNGTDWRVPIDRLDVELTIDQSLSKALTGDKSCYRGKQGSTQTCQLQRDGQVFTVQADRLDRGENVTIAIGFTPGSFASYVPTTFEKLIMAWAWLQAGLIVVATGLSIRWLTRLYRIRNRPHELGTIVPEYLPPENSVLMSAKVHKGTSHSVMTAQLLDLAIRRFIKIYEVKPKSLLSKAEYEIEIIKSLDKLQAEEREFLSDMLAGKTEVGSRLNLKELQGSYSYSRRTADDDDKLQRLSRGKYKLYQRDKQATDDYNKLSSRSLTASLLTLSPPLLVASAIAKSASLSTWSLSDKGLELRRYLAGLEDYISVAEKDRLAMLQSPEGAMKVGQIGDDTKKLIKLYERVLPYAVLFGQEKQWGKQLGEYYQQANTEPGWYSGASAFNAATLSSGLSGLSSATSYASSTSSSTGGSSGGGSSGGGGGGGGGGGV